MRGHAGGGPLTTNYTADFNSPGRCALSAAIMVRAVMGAIGRSVRPCGKYYDKPGNGGMAGRITFPSRISQAHWPESSSRATGAPGMSRPSRLPGMYFACARADMLNRTHQYAIAGPSKIARSTLRFTGRRVCQLSGYIERGKAHAGRSSDPPNSTYCVSKK